MKILKQSAELGQKRKKKFSYRAAALNKRAAILGKEYPEAYRVI